MGCASLGRALVLAVGVPGIVPSKRPGRRPAASPGPRALTPDSAACTWAASLRQTITFGRSQDTTADQQVA
jgi:hypothetical protein